MTAATAKTYNNGMHKLIETLKQKPFGLTLVNFALARKIPYVGTSQVKILKITDQELVVRIANRRPVRNHIGQVHAAAMMLLGETASGLLTGLNTPEGSLPLIKEMKTKFIKRSSGALTATARLPAESKALFLQEKGEVLISVEVKDEAGLEPVLIEATWAWIPKVKN